MSDLEPADIRLAICMPLYNGTLTEATFHGILQTQLWCVRLGIGLSIYPIRSTLVPRARNELVQLALNDEEFNATHILFIDSDIGFSYKNVDRLLGANKDIVAGAYGKKKMDWKKIIAEVRANPDIDEKTLRARTLEYTLTVDDPQNPVLKNGLLKVNEAGTGLMLIKRAVFEKIRQHFPDRQYTDSPTILDDPLTGEETKSPCTNNYDFFGLGTSCPGHEDRYLGEDFYFCRLWERCGGEIWVDVVEGLSHHSPSVEFRGNFACMIRSKPKPEMPKRFPIGITEHKEWEKKCKRILGKDEDQH